jgi:hypothetical protein
MHRAAPVSYKVEMTSGYQVYRDGVVTMLSSICHLSVKSSSSKVMAQRYIYVPKLFHSNPIHHSVRVQKISYISEHSS